MEIVSPFLYTVIVVTLNLIFFVANFALAIYVYKKGSEKRLNRTFAYLAGVNGLWNLINVLPIVTVNIFLFRLAYAFGSLLPLAGIFFAYALAEKKPSNFLKISLIASSVLFFIFSAFTPLIIRQINSFIGFGVDADLGYLFSAWAVYMTIYTSWCFITLALALPYSDEKRKEQIWYFILGAGLYAGWATVVSVFLPMFGFLNIANADSLSTIFLTSFTSYAIIKHQILGIKSLFFYAFVISLVIAVVSAGLASLMLLGSLFFSQVGILGILLIAFISSVAIVLIGESFFKKTKDLEKAKIRLSQMLEESEKNRIKAETERNKTLAVIANFSDGLLMLDTQNRIFLINPRGQKYLDIKEGALLDEPITALKEFLNLKHLFLLWDEIKNSNEKREWVIKKDLIVEVSVEQIANKEKKIGSLVVLHDITQQKLIEKMKSDFVSLAAHQLRTPSTGIRWSIRSLIDEEVGKVTKEQKRFLKRIYETNERMIKLINTLLDVNRIEAGEYLFNLKPSNIKEIVTSVLKQAEGKMESKKIGIKLKMPSEKIPLLMLDGEKLKIVFEILVDNSIEYTPAGGDVAVSLIKKEDEIEVQIKDTGYGIPEVEQKKIFSKFFRGSNITKINIDGTGLGLFAAKNIVEMQGGKIWFESRGEKGTTFYFTIPISKNLVPPSGQSINIAS